MAVKRWTAALAVVAAIGALAACGSSGGADSGASGARPADGTGALGGAPGPVASVTASRSATHVSPTTTAAAAVAATPSAGKVLTCAALRNSALSSALAKEQGYPERIQLTDGAWSGGGLSVSLRECGTGDLNGDGRADGLASLLFTNGGAAQIYYLGVWRDVAGEPVFLAVTQLGDRTPVEKVTVSDGRATVVILTRGSDQPVTATTIRRTAVYAVSGSALVELSHADAPYAG